MRGLSCVTAAAAALFSLQALAGDLVRTPTREPGQGLMALPRVLLAEGPADWELERREDAPAESAGTAEDDGIAYDMGIDGIEGDIEDRLKDVSLLLARRDQKPLGRAALLRRVEDDAERFAAALKAEGYYAYDIEHRIDYDQAPVRVTFTIDSGPVYKLSEFDIVYDDDDAPGVIQDPAQIGVTVGAAARAEPISEAPQLLLRQLGEAGYPLAKMKRRSALVDHEARAMRVTLGIAEGPRVVFGETRVTGLETVEPGYVARVADLNTGEHFNVERVDEARRRLFATGLFEGLEVGWADTPNEDGFLDVEIEAKERERRTLSFGLNYSTTEGAGADIEWQHRNLFGEDEDLTLTLKAAELVQSFRTELAAPNFWALDQRVFVAGEVAREDTEAFEERHAQVELGLSQPLGDRWTVGGGGELSILETIENNVSENNIVLAAPFFAKYDGSDDFFNPTKGYKLDFTATPAAVTLDTTDLFATFTAGGSVYQSLNDDDSLIAAARAKTGVILGPARDRIPAGRRLYAGGGGSIRGFEFQTVGPLDAAGDPEGGRSLVEFGAEVRWRITDDIGIVPFIDGGGAFEDPVPDFSDLRFAAGLGLRYYTPVGPLRLDVATPLNPRERDGLIEFYISIGQAF